jgi:surface antigen
MLGYAAVALALAGCQSTGTGSVGDAVSAYAAPTALTGRDLNAKDRRAALEAEYRALEYGRTGQPVVWRGRSGRGEVVAGPPYQVNDYDCRDYTHTITTKGQSETALPPCQSWWR